MGKRSNDELLQPTDIENAILDESKIRHELSNLCKAIERMTEGFDYLAESVKSSEKVTLLDLDEAGGNEEDAKALIVELDKRGCKGFVQGMKVCAWGEAFEKAMEREALKPIPIEPLPVDPEVEKRIWMWHCSFFP